MIFEYYISSDHNFQNTETFFIKFKVQISKIAEVEPWAQVDIDLIGPYTIKTNEVDSKGLPRELTLVATTFIDPATGWFEITKVPYEDQSSARISKLFDQTWLCRYPRPK